LIKLHEIQSNDHKLKAKAIEFQDLGIRDTKVKCN
jgi:hypothetical protein